MRNMSHLESVSEVVYLDLCDTLFSTWAQCVRSNPSYARIARGLLSNLHGLYASQQACPVSYADTARACLVRASRNQHRLVVPTSTATI